jgi:hypothetical protein
MFPDESIAKPETQLYTNPALAPVPSTELYPLPAPPATKLTTPADEILYRWLELPVMR